MKSIILKFSTLVLFLIFVVSASNAQISEKDQAILDQNEKEIERNKTAGNHAQTANYLYKSAEIYWSYDKNTEALKYYKDALDINTNLSNYNAISLISNKIGTIYADSKQFQNALPYYNKSLEAEKKINRKFNISQSLIYVGAAQRGLNNSDAAISTLNEALNIAQDLPQDINKLKLMRRIYGEMADTYRKISDADNTFKYTDLYKTFNDYVKKMEVGQIVNESEMKINIAELDKNKTKEELSHTRDSLTETIELTEQQKMKIDLMNQQKMIDSLQQREKQQQLVGKIQRQRTYLMGIIGILVLIIIFSVLIYRQFNAKKKAHKLLAEQYVVLQEQKQQIEVQSKELSKKNKQITDSIEYARKIQDAILPSKVAIRTNIPDSFIFYRPRDIVSGDFYWFSKKENFLFIAAVDCTGHSVPGAFMSMIGNTLLNEIVNEKGIYTPSEILHKLNAGVIQALKQDIQTEEEPQEDGMDLSLCRIDTQTKTIDMALANHYAYVIENNEIKTIEGDISSIGGGMFVNSATKYTNHTIQYTESVCVYMFSDGFADQMGGEKNKKFMSAKLKQLLYDNHQKDFKQQYDIIEEAFIQWKGEKHQTDDVLLIGMKV